MCEKVIDEAKKMAKITKTVCTISTYLFVKMDLVLSGAHNKPSVIEPRVPYLSVSAPVSHYRTISVSKFDTYASFMNCD